jgi:transcriptional regulator with XRE-family HTH domain
MDKEVNVAIGNRVRALRNSYGMTQDKIAKRIKVTLRMWSDVENGRKSVPLDFLFKLKEEFGVNVDYMLTGEVSAETSCPLALHYNRCPDDKKDKLVVIVGGLVDLFD